MPNDITGSSIFNPKTTDFEFRPGPLFAQIVLADEINRATPARAGRLAGSHGGTQAVTVDGANYDLPPPFFLIATQNPDRPRRHVSAAGSATGPLPGAPESRLPAVWNRKWPCCNDSKCRIPLETLETAASTEEIVACQQAVRQVHVDEKVSRYVVEIMRATREHFDVMLGGSPRASMALSRCAQAFAAINGYGFVLPDDVKQVLPFVLGHRVILRPESRLRKKTVPVILEEILDSVPVPTVAAEAR